MAAKDTSPIVFLDVDGVLNCRSTKPGTLGVRECSLRPINNPQVEFSGVVEEEKVSALVRALQACGAKIVVSSSWREAFKAASAFASAIGIPPLASAPDIFHKDWKTGWKFSSQRYHEIDWWLQDHKQTRQYAILDDHDCIPPDWTLHKHFVRTDADVGLTNADINRVLEIIGRYDLALLCETTPRDWFSAPNADAA